MPLRTPEVEQYVAEELYRAPAALCQVFQWAARIACHIAGLMAQVHQEHHIGFYPPRPTSIYQILYLLWDEKTFLQNKKMIFFHKVICFILIIFRQLSVCATIVKFYFFTTVSRQDTIIQNIYIIFNRKHNSNAQTIIAQMKKKITKTLLIEPEDEKIEMVNNVIHQSIEELLVPYEKRRTYLPRKPPKWWK